MSDPDRRAHAVASVDHALPLVLDGEAPGGEDGPTPRSSALAEAAGVDEPGRWSSSESFRPSYRRRHPVVLRPRRARVRAGRGGAASPRHRGPAPADVRHFADREAALFEPGRLARTVANATPRRGPRSTSTLLELATWARALRGAAAAPSARATRRERVTRSEPRVRRPGAACSTRPTSYARSSGWRGEIERDHPDGVVLVGVLKGALDLPRRPRPGHHPSTLRSTSSRSRATRPTPGGCASSRTSSSTSPGATSCWSRTSSTPASRCRVPPAAPRGPGAGRPDVCTLLDRPVRRILPVPTRYVRRGDPRRVRPRVRAPLTATSTATSRGRGRGDLRVLRATIRTRTCDLVRARGPGRARPIWETSVLRSQRSCRRRVIRRRP